MLTLKIRQDANIGRQSKLIMKAKWDAGANIAQMQWKREIVRQKHIAPSAAIGWTLDKCLVPLKHSGKKL
jgi:hypothetical protein